MDKSQVEEGRTDLLERLSRDMGCQYLSDLRGMKHGAQCRLVLSKIPADDYTVKTWNDAIYYITGKNKVYSTAQEARMELIGWLENGNKK